MLPLRSTSWAPLLTLVSVLILPSAFAVYADEAYQVDFHYALLGLPQPNSTFFQQPYASSKASLLYTLSAQGVVGAVNPKDGTLVWRQQLPNDAAPALLRGADGLDVVITTRGSSVTAWNAVDGKLVWEQLYQGSNIHDLHVIHDGSSNFEAVVATSGTSQQVRKLDAVTGFQKWTYEDTSADEIVRIASTNSKIYLVSSYKHLLNGSKIKVTVLESVSGTKTSEIMLDAGISSISDVIGVTAHTSKPILAWVTSDKARVKFNLLGEKHVVTLLTDSLIKSTKGVQLSATGSGSDILLNFQSDSQNWAETFRIGNRAGSIKKLWDVKSYDGKGVFSATTVGGKDYFVRVTETELILDSSSEQLATWPIASWGVPGLVGKAVPVHVKSEVAVRAGSNYAVRAAVLLSSGDWVLIRNGETGWSRTEALAGAVKAVWADVGSTSAAQQELAEEESLHPVGAAIHRLRRHSHMLDALPGVQRLQQVVLELLQRTFASSSSASFGFNKLILLATENGRLIAMDMGQRGKILWNIAGHDPGQALGQCAPSLPWTASTPLNFADILSCIKHRTATTEAASTWASAITSAVSDLSTVETTPVSRSNDRVATKYTESDGSIHGLQAVKPYEEAWKFTPYQGFRIHNVISSDMDHEPIASIGKALGDRRVLYKYLNSNAVAVITANDQLRQATIFLLDGVAGNVLWTSHIANVDTSRPIAAVMSEHWLALSYTMDSIADETVAKGYQIFMTEFYESQTPDDRGRYPSMKNYSMTDAAASAVIPHAFSQTYHIPEEIANLAVTQTGQGITTRMLLAGLPRTNSIVGIPPQVLDPRRVVGKDPTNDQMMEGLSRYTPMVDFHPQWYLNHREEVLGVREIMTTPAQLESTSIVFAYGHDLFGTRVTPSFAFDILSSSFNKAQLSFTVVGLFIAVMVAAPFIQKKQTDMLWQAT